MDCGKGGFEPGKTNRRHKNDISFVLFNGTEGAILAGLDFCPELLPDNIGGGEVVPHRQRNDLEFIRMGAHHVARTRTDGSGRTKQNDPLQRTALTDFSIRPPSSNP